MSTVVKTFKDVHEDIENESLFLLKNKNNEDFSKKGNFLKNIGFTSSIATKIYLDVSEKENLIREYSLCYGGSVKFILKSQLARVCEKYNLYVRDLSLFLGDIPEKNVQDLMKFKVDVRDLDISSRAIDTVINNIRNQSYINNTYEVKLSLDQLSEFGLIDCLQIASVESLLSKKAFEKSRDRILEEDEIDPKFKVELDPIVLLKVKGGYFIITAWGDEANDETVFNSKLN